MPGVEHAIERQEERKAKRDAEDSKIFGGVDKGYSFVLREQDDGSSWNNRPKAGTWLASALDLTLNLAVDWASPFSSRSSGSYSLGPISLQIANLPTQLRASFACTLLTGITPGPKSPLAKNLWRFLLPLCLEIRAGETEGLWIRTPQYPNGTP